MDQNIQQPGGWFNIKMTSYQYRKSLCGDKTILRPSYLHNRISYTGKMTSLYWIRALLLRSDSWWHWLFRLIPCKFGCIVVMEIWMMEKFRPKPSSNSIMNFKWLSKSAPIFIGLICPILMVFTDHLCPQNNKTPDAWSVQYFGYQGNVSPCFQGMHRSTSGKQGLLVWSHENELRSWPIKYLPALNSTELMLYIAVTIRRNTRQ